MNVDGVRVASRKEANRLRELQLMAKVGHIKDFQTQVPFVLQGRFVSNTGEKVRPIVYIADFVYLAPAPGGGWTLTAEDTKGFKTETYKIKRKLFLRLFPEYQFIES
jgi:hypothetical protein